MINESVPNDSNAIFRLIESVANVSGKNDKKALLSGYKDALAVTTVLRLAYDPFVTYGVRLPDDAATGIGSGSFTAATAQLLVDLSSRKLSGNAARVAIDKHRSGLCSESSELLRRIINKDLRAGINESIINEVFKGLIPEVPYQRCSLPRHVTAGSFNWNEGVYSQLKADGRFANVFNSADMGVRITSRQGHDLPVESLPELLEEIKRRLKPDTVSHGELLVYRGHELLKRKDGNGILNSLAEGGTLPEGHEVHLVVWDQISISSFVPKGYYNVPYKLRYAGLLGQVADGRLISMIPTRIVYSYADACAHATELQADGLEGTVYKDSEAPWEDGTSKWQVKLKIEFTVDLKIIGFTQGKGKRAKDFGALIVATEDELLVTEVAGLKEKDYATINANREKYLGSIVSVRANDLSEVGDVAKLMHGRFDDYRPDKVVADTLQQVRDQLEAVKQGA